MSSEAARQRSADYLRTLKSAMPSLGGDKRVCMLELGHGPGLLLDEASKANQHADSTFTGIEWSEDMHTLAGTIATDARVNLLMADANSQLPLPDASYDIVASAHCVYFWDDLSGSVQEQARLLKPGGVLSIAMVEAASVWDRDIYKNVDVDEIQDAMRAAGLQGVAAHTVATVDLFKNAAGDEEAGEEGHAQTLKRMPVKLKGAQQVLALQGTKPLE